jgi:DNA-binding response OmpR family regulator
MAKKQAAQSEKPAEDGKKKILIVDDDVEIVDTLQAALEANGYEVVFARDGTHGLAMSIKEDPDLMILDMMMPRRSGFLVLEKLQRIRKEMLPVIMITANEGNRHRALAEMLGVADYIHKPFPMDKLLRTVARLLGDSGDGND